MIRKPHIQIVVPRIVLILFLLSSVIPGYSSEAVHDIHRIEIQGAVRTDPSWIQDYLSVQAPISLSGQDLDHLRLKLMTTDIFKDVEFSTRRSPGESGETLIINLFEKWTTIPVMRAAYGGGTPLTVVGLYDTNGFGRLWTLGGEMHKYGNAPTGGVIWARAPRWRQGYHVLGLELWNDYRVRTIYGKHTSPIGDFTTDIAMARTFFLIPLGERRTHDYGIADRWQTGMDLKVRKQRIFPFHPADDQPRTPPADITWPSGPFYSSKVMPTLIFDNIIIDGLRFDGQRLILSCGSIITAIATNPAAEAEWFYYRSLTDDLVLAAHLLAGSVASHDPVDLYFLGGFDSLRGLPDGALYGNRALYTNVELRQLVLKSRYIWIQSALFSDVGNASSNAGSLVNNLYTTVGAGIRIFFPYVYRLAFRIDYGVSLNDSSLTGINAGMNDFFHPYRPL